MHRSNVALLALLLVNLTACNKEPAKGKALATVAEASAEAPLQAPPAGASTYDFSNEGSELRFVGAKVTGKHDGSFGAFRGTVHLPGTDASQGLVKVEIDAASLKVEPAKLAGHLKSPDFFDVEKFPKVTFTSTAIRPGGANGASHTVTGNLNLHGVAKSISFPANIRISADRVEVDSEFAINRKDFGIVYPGMPDDLIKDDVLITLKLRAKKS